jgi:hypothetical protein
MPNSLYILKTSRFHCNALWGLLLKRGLWLEGNICGDCESVELAVWGV